MSTQRQSIEDEPSAADIRALEDGLYRYNVQQTGRDDGRWLALFLRDADGTVVGGLNGWTWAGWLKVSNLWLRDDLRRQHHGSELLQAAETEAVARGCTRATLDTYSVQAPGFYQKRGYRMCGGRDFPEATRTTLGKSVSAL